MKREKPIRSKAMAFVMACITIIAVTENTHADLAKPTIPAARTAEWSTEYQRIQHLIKNRKPTADKGSNAAASILDKQALIWESDGSPVDVVIRRIEALLAHLETIPEMKDITGLRTRFLALKNQWQRTSLAERSVPSEDEKGVYLALREIQRQAQWCNPLVQKFDDILFLGYQRPGGDNHMCDQYYAWTIKNGGGIYILKNFRSEKPTLVNVLENSIVKSGRLAGKKLTGGAFLSPDLSYDAKTIVFAWGKAGEECWHIFKVNVDGSNLIQLTDGKAGTGGLAYMDSSQNDFDPCFLPNGRIVFISERRGGYLRCSAGRPCPTYTLYSMKDAGTDIIPLSYHETNEWHPSVNNDGMIVYTRWDYVDRDDCIAHHLWTCYPDGRDPRSPHGNYPLPYYPFDHPNYVFPAGKKGMSFGDDGRRSRPNGEWNIRAIPGSHKYIATASGHHEHSFGQLILLDTRLEDDNRMSQVTGITTDQTRWPDAGGPYGTAWPLSEDFYLCSYNSDLILLDRFGNQEVLCNASAVSAQKMIDPIPLIPRKVPPVIPTLTCQGENLKADSPNATISIENVNISYTPLPKDVKIKWLRVVQVIPQLQPTMNKPCIGYASETLARVPLGVVPVEKDGSVYFKAPVAKEIYFQLLDENGMAVQSMRSGTYVHPGEQMSCVGCHENKQNAVPHNLQALAMQRAPSELVPEVSQGAIPFNWHLLAKPVLVSKCGACHAPGKTPPDLSYASLMPYAFFMPFWSNNGKEGAAVYVNGEMMSSGSRTMPGRFGARESLLYKGGYLNSSHYKVSLTADEMRRITLWLDMNANELGAYTRAEEQRRGEIVWPELDMDPENPTGVETRGAPRSSH